MTFERVRVEERERLPAHPSRSRLHRLLSLGVVVPVVAFASCKKNETATPSDQAPADTAAASRGPSSVDVAQTPVPDPHPGAELETVTTSSGMGETPADAAPQPELSGAPAKPASQAATEPAAEKPGPAATPPSPPPATGEPAGVSSAAPESRQAEAPPVPEALAPADTPAASDEALRLRKRDLVHVGDGEGAPAGSLNVTPAVYEGWKHFSANCERCHGQDAVGSSFAPSLIKSIREGSVLGTGPLTHDVYIGTVVAGRPAKGMPAWVELLDREKMENIWAYLNARASGQLPPGRPIKQGG
ncbi:MAG TPA: c-type cytochrome [Gemmatimonadota bacterium]|jgi:mono/diheme cytochrome c family protein